jgi:hypothetical protein
MADDSVTLTRDEASAVVDAMRRAAIPVPWTPSDAGTDTPLTEAYRKLCRIAGAIEPVTVDTPHRSG